MRARASAPILTVALFTACGQIESDPQSSGGAPSFGGVVGRGGGVGRGGKVGQGGEVGQGGSAGIASFGSGGRTVSGGAPGQGGAVGSGGRSGSGGSAQGGSTVVAGSAGAGGTGEAVLLESSWDTVMAIDVARSTSGVQLNCSQAAFAMHLTPNGAGVEVIWGGNGDVMTGSLVGRFLGGPHYSFVRDFRIPTIGGDCGVASATVKAMRLDGSDLDADGFVDYIIGQGTGLASVLQGDVVESVEISFQFRAKTDLTPPTLVVPKLVHPLDGVVIRASEPLAPATVLTLNNGSDVIRMKDWDPAAGALVLFSASNILPFQSSWTVQGNATDLAAIALDFAKIPAVQVLDDPGVFAQDGFESTPKIATVGDVKLVSGVGNLPPIAGAQSLLVVPNSSATFHLPRPSGASTVRLTLQRLTNVNYMSGGSPSIAAGVIGGTVRYPDSQSSTAASPAATGDATWAYASAKEDIKIPFTESGTDIVVRIAPFACSGLCPPAQALLIDDLRVE
ncbi:MAG TPA: hypothetical protein VFQ35_16990 [Polyangiaceae bacterium]|nr:hypothetical protein [Polyangiaceae bacterium]